MGTTDSFRTLSLLRWTKCERENIFLKIHQRILGGENIFKYIFTTVFWGEKIYLNIFSPPYFVIWEKIYLNIFSPPKIRW